MVGVSDVAVSNWESGLRSPRALYKERLIELSQMTNGDINEKLKRINALDNTHNL
jgi:hypothetical protein